MLIILENSLNFPGKTNKRGNTKLISCTFTIIIIVNLVFKQLFMP